MDVVQLDRSDENRPTFKRSRLMWKLAVVCLWFIAGLTVYLSPLSRATLIVNMASEVTEISQLFYGVDDNYSEPNSSRQRVVVGGNELRFTLKGSYSSLRWDPAAVAMPATVVEDIRISAFGIPLPLGDILLAPLYDIDDIKKEGGRTTIIMRSGSVDPQLDVLMDFKQLVFWRIGLSALLGFWLSAGLIAAVHYRRRFQQSFEKLDATIERFFFAVRARGFNFRELGILFVIGSIFYSYFLTTFSISVDDEGAAFRTDPSVWVSQGRWFVYIIERFIFPQSAVPFAPYIMLVGALAISYVLVVRAHGYEVCWKVYALYPIFCAFPTWWFISEFYSNVPSLAFGMLFTSASVYLSIVRGRAETKRQGLLLDLMIVMFLACAIAVYQSLILFFLSMALGALAVRCGAYSGDTSGLLKSLVLNLSRIIVVSLLALAVYFSLNIAAQKFIASDSGYLGGFLNYHALLDSPQDVIMLVIDRMIATYSGDRVWYGATIGLSGTLILWATLKFLSPNWVLALVRLALWGGVLIIPFGLHFLTGGAPLPMRAMLGVAYVGWLSCAVLMSTKRASLLLSAALIIGLYQIQIFSVTSQYIASATVTQAHDRALAADIYRRIGEASEDFDRNKTITIDVFGSKVFSTVYANGWSSAMQGSFFSWDGGNVARMLLYMKLMGYGDLKVPSVKDRSALISIFQEMPIWPAAGSVKKVGDCYLVKLSAEPDPTHALFMK